MTTHWAIETQDTASSSNRGTTKSRIDAIVTELASINFLNCISVTCAQTEIAHRAWQAEAGVCGTPLLRKCAFRARCRILCACFAVVTRLARTVLSLRSVLWITRARSRLAEIASCAVNHVRSSCNTLKLARFLGRTRFAVCGQIFARQVVVGTGLARNLTVVYNGSCGSCRLCLVRLVREAVVTFGAR